MLHARICMFECRSNVIGQVRVFHFSQDSADISHHVPALIGHVFVSDLDAARPKLTHQSHQGQPVSGVLFLNQMIEDRNDAAGCRESQQRRCRLAPGRVAALLQKDLNNALDGGGRKKTAESNLAALLVFCRISLERIFQRGSNYLHGLKAFKCCDSLRQNGQSAGHLNVAELRKTFAEQHSHQPFRGLGSKACMRQWNSSNEVGSAAKFDSVNLSIGVIKKIKVVTG